MGRLKKMRGPLTRPKLESEFKCKNCGYIIHTDYVPFRSLTTKCPECGKETFEKVK